MCGSMPYMGALPVSPGSGTSMGWPNYGGQMPENWTGGYVRVPTTTVNEETGERVRGPMRTMWRDKEGNLWEGPGAGARQTTVSQGGQVTTGQSRGKVADMTPQMAAWLGMGPAQPQAKPKDIKEGQPTNPVDPIRMIEPWFQTPPGWPKYQQPSDIKTGGSAPKSPDESNKYGMLDQKRAARRKGTRRNVLTLGNPGEVTVVKRVLGA